MLIKRLDPDLPLPARSHAGERRGPGRRRGRGTRARERAVAPTGVAIALPDGYAAFVHPRSGLAAKRGHDRECARNRGRGYRGEIRVTLLNTDAAAAVKCRRGDGSRSSSSSVGPPCSMRWTTLPDRRGAGASGPPAGTSRAGTGLGHSTSQSPGDQGAGRKRVFRRLAARKQPSQRSSRTRSARTPGWRTRRPGTSPGTRNRDDEEDGGTPCLPGRASLPGALDAADDTAAQPGRLRRPPGSGGGRVRIQLNIDDDEGPLIAVVRGAAGSRSRRRRAQEMAYGKTCGRRSPRRWSSRAARPRRRTAVRPGTACPGAGEQPQPGLQPIRFLGWTARAGSCAVISGSAAEQAAAAAPLR